MDGVSDFVKWAWNWLPTVVGTVGAFMGAIAATVQLYESRTFQHWKNNWLLKYRARKLARLQRRAAITAARIQALRCIKAARTEARVIVESATTEAARITEKTAFEGATGELPSSG